MTRDYAWLSDRSRCLMECGEHHPGGEVFLDWHERVSRVGTGRFASRSESVERINTGDDCRWWDVSFDARLAGI